MTITKRLLFGIVKIQKYYDYRGTHDGEDEYKIFVDVFVFGFRRYSWIYRDQYIREVYSKTMLDDIKGLHKHIDQYVCDIYYSLKYRWENP